MTFESAIEKIVGIGMTNVTEAITLLRQLQVLGLITFDEEKKEPIDIIAKEIIKVYGFSADPRQVAGEISGALKKAGWGFKEQS